MHSIAKKKADDLHLDMDIQVDPELERIDESYGKRITELSEKLEIQEGQMKWYGKDMKGAITRSRNAIAKAKDERDRLLSHYKGFIGVSYSIEILSCGILIGE